MRWRRMLTTVGVISGISHMSGFVDDIGASRPDEEVESAAWRDDVAAGAPARRGDHGTVVVRWQDDLNEWLAVTLPQFGPIEVDGVFGPETETATRAFQDAHPQVPTDLVVDAEDQVALADALASRPAG